MPLTKLQFRPGINREVTNYTNEGGWHDCDKVRFTKGYPEKIGGWQKLGILSYLGTTRSLHPWSSLTGDRLIGFGTDVKYYVEQGGGYNDITPIRATTAAGDVTFSATDGSSTIQVSDTGHGAVAGDFVTFSGATGLGGNITADVLNQEYQITTIIDTDTYEVQAREANTLITSITVDGELSPTLVVANASDTGNGGASVVGTYQLNSGLETALYGTGWGAGFWGRGAWGSGTDINSLTSDLRIWSQDNFGEDLIINPRNGGIFYWDRSASATTYQRAVPLSDLAGASSVPTVARSVLVSDRDRHVHCFRLRLGEPTRVYPRPAADPLLGSREPCRVGVDRDEHRRRAAYRLGIRDRRCLRDTPTGSWSSPTRSLHAMQFIGPPFTFGINMISENTTLQGPNAGVAVDDTVFWMGRTEFYMYNGSVQRIPCMVQKLSCLMTSTTCRDKRSHAGLNSAHSEVWWFYPSANSQNNNRYVVYNYAENLWHHRFSCPIGLVGSRGS